MELPRTIVDSGLYARLRADDELVTGLLSLRSVVASLAATTDRTVPNFTDHTVRHMDALWAVADQLLQPEEIEALTTAEIFLIAAGFYLHDIGMAYAATESGIRRLKSSDAYRSFVAAAQKDGNQIEGLEASAIAYAVRAMHANAALDLSISPIPGTDNQYLFESSVFRQHWGDTCGKVAASHHWNIDELDSEWGDQGVIPLPGGRDGDLFYVASMLRLIDYAHINRDRARTIDRIFRGSLKDDSLKHWLAQEHIDGPARVDNELVYRAAAPQSDVDAWWLYYEMLNGLDVEIRNVKRFLDRRRDRGKALSLNGVRGASSPEEAAHFIKPDGFLPIEINLRTGSIERLVELLAGETLYGPNPMAAVRELIQNARDAVLLKGEVASSDVDLVTQSLPIRLSLNTTANPPILTVVDHGIGMTKKVMTDYLISVASSYWTSQFARDFPEVAEKGFKNAGKFGIGFLSVFMLGDEVVVESNRAGGDRFGLTLHGVGRRGELRELPRPSGSGTSVRIQLKRSILDAITPLDELVKTYAPTLTHPIQVDVDGTRTELSVGWLQELEVSQFLRWVENAIGTMRKRDHGRLSNTSNYAFSRRVQMYYDAEDGEPWARFRPEFRQGSDRLVASFLGTSLLCLRGLAIQLVSTPGFTGIIDLDAASPDASRNRVVDADLSGVLSQARNVIVPQIIENLNALAQTALIIEKYGFIASCVALYGTKVVHESNIPWIGLLKMPGNVELTSSSETLKLLTKSDSVFLAYGIGPWTALKQWVKSEGASSNEIAILVDETRQPSPRYRGPSEGIATGSLIELWPQCRDAPLFEATIQIVAEAWQTNIEDLLKQDGWTHENNYIFGRIRRP